MTESPRRSTKRTAARLIVDSLKALAPHNIFVTVVAPGYVDTEMAAEDWRALVAEFGPRLGRLRVAHVKPRGLDTVEHCMLSAIGSGLEAQVFADAHSAALWLRYGQQREPSGDR